MFLVAPSTSCQSPAQRLAHPPSLSGLVTDPTGAVISNASVVLHPDEGPDRTTSTNRNGRYSLNADPGTRYVVILNVEGFTPYISEPMTLTAARTLDIQLKMVIATQQIDVSDDNAATTDPNKNGDSIVLKGTDIDQLPLDSNELQQQLNALAGGDSPELYVNGFSGGTLPPRDSIREIRINQNPYSAQNDTRSGNGRIEIFTKPGSDALHGDGLILGSDSAFDSRNPYSPDRQPFYSAIAQGDLSGPITKKTSFSLAGYGFHLQNSAIVNAVVLDPDNNQVAFTDAVDSPTTTLSLNPRFDAQLSKNNTFSFRYQLDRTTQTNAGVGQFALASQGYQSRATTSTFQASDTEAATPHIVNELRFQYLRTRTAQTSVSHAPSPCRTGLLHRRRQQHRRPHRQPGRLRTPELSLGRPPEALLPLRRSPAPQSR